jgi:uncharacterized protein (DUF2062 family)
MRVAARKVLRRVVYSKSSASSIAGGMALGIFVGLTPTFGFQMIPAAFLAALFRVNILAAVLAVWITNPFTAAFIYYSEYWIGKLILPFDPGSDAADGIALLATRIGEISMVDLWRTVGAAISQFLSLGGGVISRLLLGSALCATAGAAVTYPVTLWAVKYGRHRRQVGAVRRADKRLAELSAAGLVHAESAIDAADVLDPDMDTQLDAPIVRAPQIVALPVKPDAGREPEGGEPGAQRDKQGA